MRKTPLFAALAIGLASALTLAGCAGGSSSAGGDGATIAIGSLYEPVNLDNTAGGGQGVTEALNGNVYEGLFKLTDEGKVEPLLATKYTTSADGLTYTFTLRDGVKFHSGKPLTSADVKRSIERVTSDDSQSARKSQLEVIKSIDTPDDKTVTITLSSRSISLPYNLSYVWIYGPGTSNYKTAEDGTGPYTLGTWKRGSSLSLERWSGYWGDKAKNKEVEFDYFTDASALSNALQTKQVDIVTSIQSPDALSTFKGNKDYTISDGKSTTKELLAFNDKVAPFNNVEVRKAVYSAIDTKKLLNSIWGDYGTLIGSMVPPSDPWYEDLTKVNPYDVNLAKKELAEAGLANGFTFTLDTPTYDPHPAVAEFLKSELAKVGITVNINSISADEWYTKVFKNHDFTATLQEHVNDRDVVWYGNPDFYWGYDNPQVTAWVNEAEQASTTADQTAKLKLVNEQIAKDAASAWLYLYPQIVVADSDVSGYPVNGLNSQFFAYDIVKK
ncbi:peptide/nickel transport system substrate-binding protein [Leifsonia sp. 98AMF]|uniref:ABC transporter substrate-binding protein n=1 Tax=unclassified Leifsonia TaxID=2663824 RepID=UPI00087C6900|nr:MULTISPECIES: ABC transporter substrate-binding protein [unclassified Leifsonia]SDH19856.1 peptide/nickel transport system substrate-binding protein [Leifsonia sp. 197AMF]SDJ18848.1 peptide/nickel transport system substrate-binding protein [Leifsonia sp. 466MF]SDJ47698.1 peptide/nickel transport system substrate-binding protein [Leifsonia sp. 157MF]SDN40146.1 peptide/nickel transport system substrate-binding protein [Leifsonia sp. 509MF]SEM80625.1 peptide/nickel transport system substrate-b